MTDVRSLILRPILRGLALCALLSAVPLRSETPEQLDALANAARTVPAGMAMAREQAARGELLEALASLERLLSLHPGSREAQLLHASLLCRIDDREGAEAEFTRLRERDFSAELWREARAPCQPAAPGGRP